MAGRRDGAPGGVIRTYARLRPLRRVEAQKWFSPPADRKHLFSSSSSSSLLDSASDPSPEDPDFIPSKRSGVSSCREINLRPERRTFSKRKKKKSLDPLRRSRRKVSATSEEEKENDERLLPPSDVVLSTPFRKFVTVRRKASRPGVTMKPPSSKPRREARPLLSPDSRDFEDDRLTVKKRRRRRRRMCSDVTDLLSPSVDSPLQQPPLLSSTPSMTLTAVPRKGNTFVRQLALRDVLEDSVVLCGTDSDSCVVNEPAASPPGVSREEKSVGTSPSGRGLWTDAEQCHTPRTKVRSGDGAGSGVKRLMVTAGNDRTLPSVCLLSPVMASSLESQSVVFVSEEKVESRPREDGHVFGASAELFSGDFTVDEEDPTDPQKMGHQPHRSSRSTNHVLNTGDSRSTNHILSTGDSRSTNHILNTGGEVTGVSRSTNHILNTGGGEVTGVSRSTNHIPYAGVSQPFVRLNSRTVTEYFRQKSRVPTNGSDQGESDDVPDPSGTTAPAMMARGGGLYRMQPVVSLDTAAVAKYLRKKDGASKDVENVDPLPRSEASAVRTFSCFSVITKTPLITTSVLKNSGPPQTTGTGRKVCISGFSAKRWGTLRKKAAAKAKLQLSFQDRSGEDFGVGDMPSSPLLFSSSLLTSSFMNSSAVMNLNLSTESMTGRDPQRDHQRWARLRAALTLHRRKKVEAGSPSVCPAERRTRGKMSLNAHNSSMLLLSPLGWSSLCAAPELTDAEKVFAECQQEGPVPFRQCLTPDQLRRCQKVGEGVYGEVFRTLRGGQHVALKVIPIEGPQKVNGENQKSFAEILPEIIISKELSLLSEGEENRTDGFIQLHSAHCVQGSYPPELLSAWDKFGKEKGTENERPDMFGPQQLFMILEFEFGGEDLERVCSRLPSVAASRSILHQVTAALAAAEEELRFEHRDLHWGNLLIEKSPSCSLSVSLGGERFDIPNAGVQVKIIDYTLSRLDKDGLTVFCDLSTDEDLFLGEGDLQFDVYRKMRQENRNVWSSYTPRSNVLWLHYLSHKLLTEVKYIKKPTAASHRRDLRRLQDFRREVQQFGSATEVLKRSRLFK